MSEGRLTLLYVGILMLSFLISLFFTWLLLGMASPEDASVFFKILTVTLLGINAFFLFSWLGFVGRVMINRSMAHSKVLLSVAARQGLQTSVFSSALITLQVFGLLNGWVILEFILLIMVAEWIWWNRDKFKLIT